MKKLTEKISLVIISLMSVMQLNCATTPVYRLEANDKTDEWYYGRQVLTKEDDLAKVKLTFEDVVENNYIFYVEAENKAEDAATLAPADIYLEPFHPVDGQKPIVLSRTNACDPEQKILSIEKSINQTNSTESTRRGLSCLVSTADFVGTVAKIGKERSKEEIEKENRERDRRRAEDENAEYNYKERINDLSSLKDYWHNEALRKTTISKDQNAGGYVHIPIPASAVNIKIVVPFGSKEYEFFYKQVKVN